MTTEQRGQTGTIGVPSRVRQPQRYRYKRPGDIDPDRFDVWSVDGNERDPTTWIGNRDETDSKSRP